MDERFSSVLFLDSSVRQDFKTAVHPATSRSGGGMNGLVKVEEERGTITPRNASASETRVWVGARMHARVQHVVCSRSCNSNKAVSNVVTPCPWGWLGSLAGGMNEPHTGCLRLCAAWATAGDTAHLAVPDSPHQGEVGQRPVPDWHRLRQDCVMMMWLFVFSPSHMAGALGPLARGRFV